MFKRLTLGLAVCAAGALTVGGVALAEGGFSRDGGAKDQRLVLRDIEVHSTFVDVDGSNGPPTPGDEFVSVDVLKQGSTVVGHLFGRCMFVRAPQQGPATLRCEATAALKDGSLEFAGTGLAAEHTFQLHFAIVGGTGIYDEVDGQGFIRGDGDALVLDIDA